MAAILDLGLPRTVGTVVNEVHTPKYLYVPLLLAEKQHARTHAYALPPRMICACVQHACVSWWAGGMCRSSPSIHPSSSIPPANPPGPFFSTRTDQINAIAAEAAALGHVTVELSVQRPTGTFALDFLDGMWSAYTNVTNILVRVAPATPPATPPAATAAVLLSAHYDAALGSPGASDDLAAIGVLMEVLRNVVHSPPREHVLIFNFNGAEENILQASHGQLMTRAPPCHDLHHHATTCTTMPRLVLWLQLECMRQRRTCNPNQRRCITR